MKQFFTEKMAQISYNCYALIHNNAADRVARVKTDTGASSDILLAEELSVETTRKQESPPA